MTASGLRLGPARFAWHRVLRILPGFWACLVVTAFVIALVGGAGAGRWVYIALSLAATSVLAALSWHLVEKPAMSLKDWTPPRRSGRRESEHDARRTLSA